LTGFLKGDFRQEKGHQLLNFGEIGVDGLEKSIKGINPFKAAFYFLSYLPGKINK